MRAAIVTAFVVLCACGTSGSDASSALAPPIEHRASADACFSTRAPGTRYGPSDGGTGNYACASDADCTAGTNGRCGGLATQGAFLQGSVCSYDACASDADCGMAMLCLCGGVVGGARTSANVCVRATCRTDADCGAGGFCSPTVRDG